MLNTFLDTTLPQFKARNRDLPGGPVVRTLHFHRRGSGFGPQSGNEDPASHAVRPKIKKNKIKLEINEMVYFSMS